MQTKVWFFHGSCFVFRLLLANFSKPALLLTRNAENPTNGAILIESREERFGTLLQRKASAPTDILGPARDSLLSHEYERLRHLRLVRVTSIKYLSYMPD